MNNLIQKIFSNSTEEGLGGLQKLATRSNEIAIGIFRIGVPAFGTAFFISLIVGIAFLHFSYTEERKEFWKKFLKGAFWALLMFLAVLAISTTFLDFSEVFTFEVPKK